jgi:16S rRNA (guanine(527)-N(7))-methyltransferase RsmG
MPTPLEQAQLIVNKSVTIDIGDSRERLTNYLAQVLEWNLTLGLVSRKDPVAACERLLSESIELAETLQIAPDRRVADIGSGAGFPGVVWALLFPQIELVLIERRQKRAMFLERVCRTLPLDRATVIAADVRELSGRPDLARSFDLVVTVAVGDPLETGPLVEDLLKVDSRFASTVTRDMPPPARVGEALHLERQLEGKFGCYAIYRRGV